METFLFYFAAFYLSACTVLAINVLKYVRGTFRWNFVWTKGQKCGFVLGSILCSYIIPVRVYIDTFGEKK
ncbi:hypothetical protein Asfd1_196 [Aeromonas phage Asfd_1]|nr:hypothetical protein Asfd1_196 [Aeromonas phage Asfd_1]